MTWGDSWGRSPSNNAKAVAEAFFAGRRLTRSNCVTEGWHYKLFGSVIASRVPPEREAAEITKALLNQPFRRSLEFSFAGHPTQATCRHLGALGLEASFTTVFGRDAFGKRASQTICLLNGRRVDPNRFYTLEELAEMPEWVRPVEEKPVRNMTKAMNLELNFG